MCTKLAKPEFCPIGSWIKWYIVGEGPQRKLAIENTYNTRNPNIQCFHGKVRHNWHLMQLTWGSNDMQEDIWFGYSTLATQCWYIYFVANEQSKTLVELWDGSDLNCAFRRTFTGSCSQLIRIVKSKRCSTLRCLPRFRCLCLF